MTISMSRSALPLAIMFLANSGLCSMRLRRDSAEPWGRQQGFGVEVVQHEAE